MAAAGCRQTSELTEPNRLCGAICTPFVSAVAAVFFAPDTLPRTDIHRFSVRHGIAGEKCVVFRDCVNALAGSNGNINTSGISENNVYGTYRPNDRRATETESPTRYVYDNGIRGAEGIDRPGFFIGDFIGKTLS